MDKQTFLKNYLVDRHGTSCVKWDGLKDKFGDSDLIAMWVADMEFRTCDEIIEAMEKRTRHGIFGYSSVPGGYFEAFSNWMEKRYRFKLEKEWVRYSTGCVTGIAWMLAAYTRPKDACLILTPIYYPFHNVVTYNNRTLITVDLDYFEGYFTMNMEAIEKAIIENDVKMFLMCSPHNPTGRVWTEEELDKVLSICKKHNVLVVSDEIHQDIVLGNKPFVPAAVVGNGKYKDIILTLNSASKTFNLAGLPHSHIIITDEKLREQYDLWARGMNRTECNVLALEATMAGYTYGHEWAENVLEIIKDNYTYLCEELSKSVPDITVCVLEGTYLVMLDLRKVVEPDKVKEFIQDRCRLAVDYGEWFGTNFKGFIRLNLATDPENVKQAAHNIIEGLLRK